MAPCAPRARRYAHNMAATNGTCPLCGEPAELGLNSARCPTLACANLDKDAWMVRMREEIAAEMAKTDGEWPYPWAP